MVRVISLMYHDVVNKGDFDSSGFPGMDAATYKLECEEFEKHLRAIARAIKRRPVRAFNLQEAVYEQGVTYTDETQSEETRFLLKNLVFRGTRPPFLFTFDDGGVSAYTCIADILESFEWYGHFFITVNHIGVPSFLNIDQIRSLRKRGHVIGTHSCSHPDRMSACNWEELIEEWGSSVKVLSNILGEQVNIASLPGGYCSKKIAKAASAVGIKVLFTSEPTIRRYCVDGCLVLGRYAVRRWTSPEIAAGLAAGQLSPRLKQYLCWNLKKIAKSLSGEFYMKMSRSFWSKRPLNL